MSCSAFDSGCGIIIAIIITVLQYLLLLLITRMSCRRHYSRCPPVCQVQASNSKTNT